MLFVCDQPHSKWYEYLYWGYGLNSPHNSKHMFDIYSVGHVWWFAVLSYCVLRMFPTHTTAGLIGLLLFGIAFEVFENQPEQIVKYNRIEVGSNGVSSYRGDTIVNVVGDVISNVLGMYCAIWMSSKQLLATLVVLFVVITSVVGVSYWTDVYSFTGVSGRTSDRPRIGS